MAVPPLGAAEVPLLSSLYSFLYQALHYGPFPPQNAYGLCEPMTFFTLDSNKAGSMLDAYPGPIKIL